eukprot:TRINITY_DN35377_c0_g2_i1.p2 TRINITY_DN35377_c0_g2~~TRINITY_DN35377_c0_g2_i1.p2  ORF type:complete len:124 (+),score=7.85 TRINITY_DN35377_c0_g2_i1:103-474(+)
MFGALRSASERYVRKKIGSSVVEKVYRVLKTVFPTAVMGVLIENAQLQIKIVVSKGGQRVAVEVLTSGMYTISKPRTILGTTSSYLNCLQALGFNVVPVSYLEWDDIEYQNKTIEIIRNNLMQ